MLPLPPTPSQVIWLFGYSVNFSPCSPSLQLRESSPSQIIWFMLTKGVVATFRHERAQQQQLTAEFLLFSAESEGKIRNLRLGRQNRFLLGPFVFSSHLGPSPKFRTLLVRLHFILWIDTQNYPTELLWCAIYEKTLLAL